jgi:large subunit ribosomal protein L32e
MMKAKEAKELIKKLKKKKPKFVRSNYGRSKRKRVKENWRKPRGIDNKKRIGKKYAGRRPKIGYKNPEEIRFRRRSGKLEFLVHNVEELQKIPSKDEYIAVIAHDVGKKKRIEIIEIAKKLGIEVANDVV